MTRRLVATATCVLALVAALAPAAAADVDRSAFGRHADRVAGTLAPLASQVEAAQALGATVRWTDLGTPKVVIEHGGTLAPPRTGPPADVARAFLRDHRTLFGLSGEAVDALRVVRVSPLHESPAYRAMLQGESVSNDGVPHVVLLQQTFDGVAAVGGTGLVSVGITGDGAVAFVGSSLTRHERLQGSRVLAPVDAIRRAAADAGLELGALDPAAEAMAGLAGDTFLSSATGDQQLVRARALPTPDGVRRVFEVTLLDTSMRTGEPIGFVSTVDTETGRVWTRNDAVDHQADTDGTPLAAPALDTFEGTAPGGRCGPRHPFDVDEGNGQITVVATGLLLEDITITLYRGDEVVATQDVLTSPEALVHAPSGGLPAGTYEVEICPFDPSSGADIAYTGTFTATPAVVPGVGSPAWRVFPNTPHLPFSSPEGTDLSEDIRELWCWDVADGDPMDDSGLGRSPDECDGGDHRNVSSRLPWDALTGGVPTFTTLGNNASAAVSNVNFIAPDTVFLRPVSPDRTYDVPWTDAWRRSGCDPTTFVDPTRNFNDQDAATINLFTMYNRLHDWSYLLGWTEVNSNLQLDNFGLTEPTRGLDPEMGSSQAGRLNTGTGRDNANQLTLQDGIPGFNNQYLWQPLPAVFYPPCVDGAYDLGIIVHEYTHATTNRMTGGPDGSLGGGQDGRMGEAWSDLAAIEFANSHGLVPDGVNRFSEGAYATGDPQAGIRNWGINHNPLRYGDMEYDGSGATSPHADSEIWGGVHYDLRTALVDRYADQFPESDTTLQRACAAGDRDSERCPGNRRWLHLVYDGLLLQPAGPTMLDARDAILAADVLRYGGENQAVLWDAFAGRGMGEDATTTGVDDLDPTPGYTSPERDDEAVLTFRPELLDGGQAPVSVFVGQFEARTTPSADTDPATEDIDEVVELVPGTYDLTVRAPGYGIHRFAVQVEPGRDRTVTLPLRPNLASTHQGATAAGDGDATEDEDGDGAGDGLEAQLVDLIDDTEATNWQSITAAGTDSAGKGEGAFVEGRQVTVELADRTTVAEVAISAALHPGGQNRFTALRSFDLLACDATVADCDDDASFTRVYASADDAFPGHRPRPRVADLMLRTFDVDDTVATHLRIVVRDNQCTGGPDFQRETNPTNDPVVDPDCDTGINPYPNFLALLGAEVPLPEEPPADEVRIAELQVFEAPAAQLDGPPSSPPHGPPDDPPGRSGTPGREEAVVAGSVTAAAAPLPATGSGLALLGVLLLGAGSAVRRRR